MPFLLLSIFLQGAAVVIAKRFLDKHQEQPLSTLGNFLPVIVGVFTLLSFMSALGCPTITHTLFSLIFYAFLALFFYLDAASRCLPRCFTLAFGLIGFGFRVLLSPESVLTILLTALSLFGVLFGLRALAHHKDGHQKFGLGDVYLMAGLGVWLSLPIVLWVIIGAVFLAGFVLLARRLGYPKRWQQDDDFRYLPFAPFLCSVVAFYALNRDVTLNYWFFL
ncbi:prepilin peptidase [Arsenophonus apicola]|uniref:A24 family peptidase n=1 Tax=Arsenophonus apicola TaxID=2879119 RepID=A0ABY8P1F2_9GAMM|nr:A24 family peptidase [Arsenophonus apicola]WGO82234.1 A24 family peptidase [Arsenophonus apicola]